MYIRKSKLSLSLALATFLGLCSNVNAEPEKANWYLSLHTGLSSMEDTEGRTAEVGLIDGVATVNLDSGFLTGMAVGYQIRPEWSVELAWDYRSNDSKTTLADGTSFNDGNYASNIFYLNGIYHFRTESAWKPYVGMGLGWIQEIDLDLEDSSGEISYATDGDTAVQFIAGIGYELNEAWRINARLRYSDFGDIDLDGEEGASGNISGLEYAPATAEFGVSYSF